MFERFTKSARDTVVDAQRLAIESKAGEIGTAHLLAAMLDRPGPFADLLREHGVSAETLSRTTGTPLPSDDETALASLGIDLAAVREAVESAFGEGALDRPNPQRASRLPWRRGPVRHLPFSRDAKQSLEQSLREALRLSSNEIGVEHIALGVLRTKDPTLAGLDVPRLRDVIELHLREAA